MADGTYATPIPLQIFAYRTAQILMTNVARQRLGQAEPPRGPDPRAHPHPQRAAGRVPAVHAVAEARLHHRRGRGLPDRARARSHLTEQERLAVEFLDLLSADHHAIDDEIYRELGEVFTAAQIVELGFTCANTMGLHRFIHTLDVYGTEPAGHRLRPRPGRRRHAPTSPSRRRHERDGPRHRRHRTGRRQHLQAPDRAGRHRPGPGPGRRRTPARWSALGVEVVTRRRHRRRRRPAGRHRERLGHPLRRAPRWRQPEPAPTSRR